MIADHAARLMTSMRRRRHRIRERSAVPGAQEDVMAFI